MSAEAVVNPGSFRDPSGFVFDLNNITYRQINRYYEHEYETLVQSGLYQELTNNKLIIEHKEVDITQKQSELAYKIIRPDQIRFISYPYEWSFSQLKDAALLTLEIAKIALDHDMILKDASAFNVQFEKGKPIFIDTLSFEDFQEKPWIAYLQFCQHFLAPLAIAAHTNIPANKLFITNLDGIPLEIASEILPIKNRLSLGLLAHIYLHAKAQKKYSGSFLTTSQTQSKVSKSTILGILSSLESTIKNLKFHSAKTEWSSYYEDKESYTDKALLTKKKIIESLLTQINPRSIIDIGANTGEFSRLATLNKIFTVSTDYDHLAVESNYKSAGQDSDLLPLVIDITNPSPAIGWLNQERKSFLERSNFDLSLSLALMHHLNITFNVPFDHIFKLLAKVDEHAIIEFVPFEDEMVQRLIHNRKDSFEPYSETDFIKSAKKYFQVLKTESIDMSMRKIFLFKRNYA